jgi:Transglycosylase SLT domain
MPKCCRSVYLAFCSFIAANLFVQTSALAKDRPEPPAPCPLSAKLRVADAASLAGIRSLESCAGQIIVAPASAADYVEPRDLSIDPDAPRTLTSFTENRVTKISPSAQEPESSDLAQLGALTTPDAILTMKPVSYRTQHDAMITRVAQRHRIDPLLLHAVINQESRYRENATSPVGARGLMQLMPATARVLGINGGSIAQAESNVDGGARLLRRLYTRYNNFPLVLAAYNAGEGAVRKYGNQVPPYAETQNYVRSVMANYNHLVAEQNLAER